MTFHSSPKRIQCPFRLEPFFHRFLDDVRIEFTVVNFKFFLIFHLVFWVLDKLSYLILFQSQFTWSLQTFIVKFTCKYWILMAPCQRLLSHSGGAPGKSSFRHHRLFGWKLVANLFGVVPMEVRKEIQTLEPKEFGDQMYHSHTEICSGNTK